jgi:hypothetical protein
MQVVALLLFVFAFLQKKSFFFLEEEGSEV